MMSSALEVKIHNILTDYDVPFEEEYMFDDLIASSGRHLRFDFAVFSEDGELDFLIEAQGKQHYTAVNKFGGQKGVNRQKYNDLQKLMDYAIKEYNKVDIWINNAGVNQVMNPVWNLD